MMETAYQNKEIISNDREKLSRELITKRMPELIDDYVELIVNDPMDMQKDGGDISKQEMRKHVGQLNELNNLVKEYRDRPQDFKPCSVSINEDEEGSFYRVSFRDIKLLPKGEDKLERIDKQLCLAVIIPNQENKDENLKSESLHGYAPYKVINKINTYPVFKMNVVSVFYNSTGQIKSVDNQNGGIGLTLSGSQKVDVFGAKYVGKRPFQDPLNIGSKVNSDQFKAVTGYVIESAQNYQKKRHQVKTWRG